MVSGHWIGQHRHGILPPSQKDLLAIIAVGYVVGVIIGFQGIVQSWTTCPIIDCVSIYHNSLLIPLADGEWHRTGPQRTLVQILVPVLTCYPRAQQIKNPPAIQEMRFWSLSQEDSLEEGMATHSNILIGKIPWTEEPGRLKSMVSQRVGSDWAHIDLLSHCEHLC